MATGETATEPLDIVDILRGVIDLAADFNWDHAALATAIHGIVRPFSLLSGGDIEDVALRVHNAAGRVETVVEEIDGSMSFSLLRPRQLMDLGFERHGLVAELLAKSLSGAFQGVDFLHLEGVVLRALEIVREKSGGDHA